MRVLLLLLSFTAFAQNSGLDRIRADYLRADLTFLSSDALEGRLSLHRGDDAAIEWIASEFAKAGLKPLAGDSFLQRVPLIEYRVDRAASKVTVYRGGRATPLTGAQIASSRDLSLRAPLVFAGYGITAPELNYDDYAGIDAKGKVVLVLSHEPQEQDKQSRFHGTGLTRYASPAAKVLNAQQHGAVAVITVPEPYAKHHPGQPEPQAGRVRRPDPQALGESEARLPTVSVNEKTAASLFASEGMLAEAQAKIDQTGRPASKDLAGVEIALEAKLAEARQGFSANVIGLLEGSDPSLKQDTIIFSAHHDHDGMPAGDILHGADDNGSGTVGVVALARAFAARAVKPKRSLLFAVFTAEERGLLGAYYYTAHPLRPLATTRAVINFDMIGRNEAHVDQSRGVVEIPADTSNEMNLVGTVYSPDYRAAVEKANRQIGLILNDKFDHDAAMNIPFRSDQYPFVLKGIPAVWWFTGLHPDYHQATDTVEKINFPKMEKILKLAYLTGESFADAEVPRFQAAR